jgi:tetratricopeptide (TPR) repeat protein
MPSMASHVTAAGRSPRGFLAIARRHPWLGAVAAAPIVAMAAWVGQRAREEWAVRSEARTVRNLVEAGEHGRAAQALERWLKARPDSAEAMFLKARCELAARSYGPGFADLDRARTLGYPIQSIERERAIALSRVGRHAEAEPILRGLYLKATTPDHEVIEALARSYLETFQLGAATKVIARWIQDRPGDAKAYLWKAELDSKTAEEASVLIDDYEKVVQRDPGSDKARLALAELYRKAHRLGEAQALYLALLEEGSKDAEVYLGLGQTTLELGDEAKAVEYLDRGLELAPGKMQPLIERAKIDLRHGKFAAALAFLDRAREIDATEIEVHYLRGLVLSRQGRQAEAREEQEIADRLRKDGEELKKLHQRLVGSPRDLKLQYEAAKWLFDHGHPEEGLRWAEKILKEKPGDGPTGVLLADYYQKKGNPGLANFYRSQASGVESGIDRGRHD